MMVIGSYDRTSQFHSAYSDFDKTSFIMLVSGPAIVAFMNSAGGGHRDRLIERFAVKLDRQTLNKVFLTHQQCLEKIILCDGGNSYKLPHMGKERLLRQGQLPVSIGVTDEPQQEEPQQEAHEA
jgi:hypothetical protein